MKLDNINGLAVPDWDAEIDVTNHASNVTKIAVSNNHVYIAGNLTQIDGTAVGRLARLEKSDASLDADWNPMANTIVNVLYLDGNTLYAGGAFTFISGVDVHRIARFNITTGLLDIDWVPELNGEIHSIKTHGNSVFVGGQFSQVNAQNLPGVAKINSETGNPDLDWNPSPNNIVRAIEITGERLWAGGSFTHLNGFRSHMLASFTGLDAPPGVAYAAEITGPNEGWRILTAPTTQATYAGLLENIWTQGYPGSGNPGFGSNVLWYDETARQWNIPESASNTIGTSLNGENSTGKAILVYVYEDDNANGISDGWPKEYKCIRNSRNGRCCY